MPAHIKFKQELFSGLTTPSSAYTSVFVGKTAGPPSYNQGNISARLADGQLYRVPYLEQDLTYATGKEFKGNVDIAQDLTVYGNLNWTGSSSDTFVTGGTLSASTLTLTRNDGQNINISGFLTLSGNTSGSCIDTLWVSSLSGCSPVVIGPKLIVNGDTYMNGDLHLCSSGTTLFVDSMSGCSPIHFGPSLHNTEENSKLTIGGKHTFEVDSWSNLDGSSIAIQTISGGTTGTTIMNSDLLIQDSITADNRNTSALGRISYMGGRVYNGVSLQSQSGTTSATTLMSSKAMVQQHLDGDTFKLLSISADGDTCCTGWECMAPGTCVGCPNDGVCVGYLPPDSQSLSLTPGDGFNLRTFSGTTSAETTTIVDSSKLSLTKSLPTLGLLHKINMEVPCGDGTPASNCGDSSHLTQYKELVEPLVLLL